MTRISAVETFFDGTWFRSRTECRWAVHLKAHGLRFEYEPGWAYWPGYSYLPDFWLPDLNAFLEVKGKPPTPDEVERCRVLSTCEGRAVLISNGPPQDTANLRLLLWNKGCRLTIATFDHHGTRADEEIEVPDDHVFGLGDILPGKPLAILADASNFGWGFTFPTGEPAFAERKAILWDASRASALRFSGPRIARDQDCVEGESPTA